MIVGIDAKWYFSGNISGRVVIRNYINNLIDLNDESTKYIIFFNKKDFIEGVKFEERIKYLPNIEVKYCNAFINILSNLFILPFLANKYRCDTFLFQSYTPFLFSKKISYKVLIFDFLFYDYPQYFSISEIILYRLMSYFSRFAEKIITISIEERNRIIKYTKRNLSDVSFIYLGVSNDFSSVQSDGDLDIYNELLPDKYLLYVGRINIRKNIKILLRAITELDVKLVIIGPKDHKSFDIDDYIEELNISNKVIFLGQLPYMDLVRVVQKSFMFIFPSYAEGFGMPPIEAMKASVPVICSNSTCLPEICGNAALYFSPNDVDLLRTHILSLIENEELRNSLIKKGQKRVLKYNWKIFTSELVNRVKEFNHIKTI